MKVLRSLMGVLASQFLKEVARQVELRNAPLRAMVCVCLILAAWQSIEAQSYQTWQHRAWGTVEGLPQNSVHAIAQTPDGFLWIATEAGLARFDGVRFTTYSSGSFGGKVSDDLCCLALDGHGVLWIGSSFGIAAIDHLQSIPLPDRAPYTRTSVHELRLERDHIVAVTDSGTFSVDSHGGAVQMASSAVRAHPSPVLEDHLGNLWHGSASGLRELVAPGKPAIEFPSLQNQNVLSLFEDPQGNLWVGTETTGLHCLSHRVFVTSPGTEGALATAVVWSSQGVLFGSRDGEVRLGSATGRSRIIARCGSGITAFALAADVLWAGTTDGLYRIDKSHRIRRFTSADGLPDDYIRSLAAGGAGDLWVGTAHGLTHLTSSAAGTFPDPVPQGEGIIGPLLQSQTHAEQTAGMWAATERGLRLFRGAEVEEAIDLQAVVAGMSYDRSGALWFATQDGWLWQSRGGSARRVLPLPLLSPRQAVRALYVDRRDTLWIVLHDGLLSASSERLARCTPQTCSSLTALVASWSAADGIPSTETLPGGFGGPVSDKEGNVLFATRAGVAVADPDQAAKTLLVPVVIERTTLEDRPLAMSQPLVLHYGRTRLTFDYAGIALIDAGRVRYRVRLNGFDSDWVENGTNRSVSYTALPPGDYRFQVQATLDGQPWPDASSSLPFRVAPPFYRRWWFLVLSGIFFMGLYFLISRLRVSVERRRFALVMAERNRLAREVHDTLAQDLVSTGIQLDVILFVLSRQSSTSALELLKTLRRSVGQAITEARESIGDLRNPDLRFDLVSRLRRMVERKTTTATVVTIQVDGSPKALTSGVEMELLRITSEAVQNAVKHAGATSVEVQVLFAAGALEIIIADSSRGFDPLEAEGLSGHYGLRGMRERAEAIGANCIISARPGSGTKVSMSVGYR